MLGPEKWTKVVLRKLWRAIVELSRQIARLAKKGLLSSLLLQAFKKHHPKSGSSVPF